MLKSPGKCRPNVALREARKSRNLTQSQLAAELGVDEKTIRRWENGSSIPRSYAQKKLAALLGKCEEDLGFAFSEETEQDQEAILEGEQQVLTEKTCHISLANSDSANLRTHSYRRVSPMNRSLLFGVLLGAALVLIATLLFSSCSVSSMPISFPSPVSKILPSSTLHQVKQNCVQDSNETGYLKIATNQNGKEEIFCYEGIGSISLSLGNVREVEVGNIPAQWTYVDIAGKNHLTPMSGNPNLYWCPRNIRFYQGRPIRILQITVSPHSSGQTCTNGQP